MASLDFETKANWTKAISNLKNSWVLFGLDSKFFPMSERMNGMAGLIDWFVHGQVSQFILDQHANSEFFLIPSTSSERPHFLLYHYSGTPDWKKLSEKLTGLKIKNLSLASSTFPEDFSKKLKQNLERDGIQWTKLEPDPK